MEALLSLLAVAAIIVPIVIIAVLFSRVNNLDGAGIRDVL